MNILKKSALMGAALLALGINVANASMATGARDPYTDGGRAARDIYTDGAHSMGTRDPYTDGGHQ